MKETIWAGMAVVGSLCCISSVAGAEPRTHDGFQFRGALGAGYLRDSESIGSNPDDFKMHGAAASLELYFGGSPADGVTIGGFVSAFSAPGPTAEYQGQTSTAANDVSLNLSTVGPYLDWYPDPHGGFHVLGTLGYARASVSNGDNDGQSTASTGIGLGLGVGYDAWISDQWSLGVLGRFTYAHAGHDEGELHVKDNIVAPAILLSINYH